MNKDISEAVYSKEAESVELTGAQLSPGSPALVLPWPTQLAPPKIQTPPTSHDSAIEIESCPSVRYKEVPIDSVD